MKGQLAPALCGITSWLSEKYEQLNAWRIQGSKFAAFECKSDQQGRAPVKCQNDYAYLLPQGTKLNPFPPSRRECLKYKWPWVLELHSSTDDDNYISEVFQMLGEGVNASIIGMLPSVCAAHSRGSLAQSEKADI